MKGRKKMNSKKKLYGSAALLSLLLLVGCAADDDTASSDSSAVGSSEVVESSSEQDESMMAGSEENDMGKDDSNEAPYIYGAVGALADDDLTMEEMFTYAIQDEQLAHGEYAYVLETFGDQAPFNNIVSAEAQHISEMTVLFEKYNLAIPSDESADHIERAANVREALENCATGEVDNISMYNKFLEQDIPDDVRATFTALRNASEGHLQSFRKSLEKY
jgi:rubrerythrin